MSNGRRFEWWQWPLPALFIVIIKITLFQEWPIVYGWLAQPGEHPKYLLSATAQVLAALFALVFSITLIATQFVTKYTHRTMAIIFNKKVIRYMCFFVASVITPLVCLIKPSLIISIISLIFGSVMTILLVPFFLDLKRRMNIGWIITCLKEEGLKAVADKNFERARDNIEALDNISMGAYGDHNYDVFNLAVKALADYVLDLEWETEGARKSIDGSEPPEEELHRLIFKALRDTFREVIDNPRAPYTVLVNIERIGDEAVLREQWRMIDSIGTFLKLAEEFSTKTATQPITDHRKTLSVACCRVLHKYIVALPKDEFEPGFHDKLIFSEINMHNRHLSKEWSEYLIQDHVDSVELAQEVIRWKGIRPQIIDSVTAYLFKYLDIFKEINDSAHAENFTSHIKSLFDTLRLEVYNQKVTDLLFEKIKNYSENFIDAEDEDWKEVGELLHLDLIRLTYTVLVRKDYNRYWRIQTVLFQPKEKNHLSVSALEQILYAFIQQILDFQDEIFGAMDNLWAAKTVDWFRETIKDIKKKAGWDKVMTYRGCLKSILKDLVKLGLEKGYTSVGNKVYCLIFHAIDIKPKNLSDSWLFRYLWLVAAVIVLQDEAIIYAKGSLQTLHIKSFTEQFFKEYKSAVRIANWLGLHQEILAARKTIDEAWEEMDYPPHL